MYEKGFNLIIHGRDEEKLRKAKAGENLGSGCKRAEHKFRGGCGEVDGAPDHTGDTECRILVRTARKVRGPCLPLIEGCC